MRCPGSIVHGACPDLVVVLVVVVDVNVSRDAIQIDALALVFQNSWQVPPKGDRGGDLVSQQRRLRWTRQEDVSLTVACHLKHGERIRAEVSGQVLPLVSC